jgi:hypothetical protein
MSSIADALTGGGAQTAQAGTNETANMAPQQVAAAAPAALAPQMQFTTGPSLMATSDPTVLQNNMKEIASQQRVATQLANTARTPEDYDKYRAQAEGLRVQHLSTQLYAMAQSNDVVGMLNAYRSHTNARIGVADAGNGNYVFTDGKDPITPPMSKSQAANWVYGQIDPVMRQLAVSMQQKVLEARLKTEGEVTLERLKQEGVLNKTMTEKTMEQAMELIKQGFQASEIVLQQNMSTGEITAMPKYQQPGGGGAFTIGQAPTPGGGTKAVARAVPFVGLQTAK